MMRTNTTLSIACVPDARVHCADPKGTMLRAENLGAHLRGITAWNSAGQLQFVLGAMSTYYCSVAGAARYNTLAKCSMLSAQTTCL